jgi:hypothetical protein
MASFVLSYKSIVWGKNSSAFSFDSCYSGSSRYNHSNHLCFVFQKDIGQSFCFQSESAFLEQIEIE